MPRQKLYSDEEVAALSIRLPASLKALIEQRAQANRRSLNQEIVWLLERAIELLSQEPGSTGEQSSR